MNSHPRSTFIKIALVTTLAALNCAVFIARAAAGSPAYYYAAVLGLWPVQGAAPGATMTLGAQVKNISFGALPADARVMFWVDGPNWADSHWVGSTSAASLEAGAEQWFPFDWKIPTTAQGGAYTYWAQVWSTNAISDWSGAQGFSIGQQGLPGKAILISPSGSISSTIPAYGWKAVPAATWYFLWVNDSTTNSGKIRDWYTAAQAGCVSGTGTCSITPSTAVASGSAQWWIQTWNDNGYGPWSDGMSFDVAVSAVQILALMPITNAMVGSTIQLRAQVKNGTDSALSSDCVIRFWVSDMLNPWVGLADLGGLSPGQIRWCSLDWQVSAGIQPGAHVYKAQIFVQTNEGFRQLSGLSAGADLIVTGPTSTTQARINRVFEVGDAPIGGQAILQAEIQNIGTATFSAPTRVWFRINGIANSLVGSNTIGGLPPGATATYTYAWDIPNSVQPGTYSYQACVYWNSTTISDWSSEQRFTISSPGAYAAQILDIDRVTDAAVGGKTVLGAQVKNIGTQSLPWDAQIWFWVDGGNLSNHWVGFTSLAGLTAGTMNWFNFAWTIPPTEPGGTYSYKAQAWAGDKPISGFGPSTTFTVSGDPKGGFDEPFTDGSAPNWIRDYGTWGVANGFYSAPGEIKSVVTSSFNVDYADFDFSASVYRAGLEIELPAFLEVRASGSATGPNHALRNGYCFQYNPRGEIAVVRYIDGRPTILLDWILNAAVRQGQAFNTLRVKAVSIYLSYYINNILVWSGADDSFASGRVGFGFYSDTGAAGELLAVDWAKLSVSP